MIRRLALLSLLLGSLTLPTSAQVAGGITEIPRRPPGGFAPPPAARVPPAADDDTIGEIQSSIGGAGRAPRPARPAPDAPADPPASPRRPAPAAPAATIPPPVAAPAGPDARPLPQAALVALAEAASVFIVADDGTGSGFFVTSDTIATNAHVVNGARNGTVLVASRKLGRVLRGRVLYQSNLNGREWPDVAFVRVEANAAPAVITLSPEVAKLDPVVAAGYPGLLTRADQGVRRLVAGEAGQAPELVFERGTVATFNQEGVNLVVHSAFLASGNSGGPLLDPCGRAVGINSAILRDQRAGGQYNIAQDVQELVRQAARLSIPIQYVGGKCNPA